MSSDSPCHGLFVGLTTLDLIYRAPNPPTTNQKIVATDYTLSAGGPATNAAVAFAHWSHRATLLSVVGSHPMTPLIRADLQQCQVHLADLAPQRLEPPPISSIIVTEATGERAVVSINAVKTQVTVAELPTDRLQTIDPQTINPQTIDLQTIDIVLIDGHQMDVGRAIAQRVKHSLKHQHIPVVIDGGSWKPGFESVLPFVDYAICSANFHPPGCQSDADTLAYLTHLGIPYVAITHGEQPIQYWSRGEMGEVVVPQVQARDTLGAGDIFHGVFCHAILRQDFVAALATAAKIAAHSCQFFGTRLWMEGGREDC